MSLFFNDEDNGVINDLKIYVRMRPETTKEKHESKRLKIIDKEIKHFRKIGKNKHGLYKLQTWKHDTIKKKFVLKSYFFDNIFDTKSTQNNIFNNIGKKLCNKLINGESSTIILYGQNGAGKSHTLLSHWKYGLKNSFTNCNSPNIVRIILNYWCYRFNIDLLNDNIWYIISLYLMEYMGLFPRCFHYIFNCLENMVNNGKILLYELEFEYIHIINENKRYMMYSSDNESKIECDSVNNAFDMFDEYISDKRHVKYGASFPYYCIRMFLKTKVCMFVH